MIQNKSILIIITILFMSTGKAYSLTPDEIESFAFGFDLNSASYSGGAGGTFANLVTGGEDWIVNGATPSFSTDSGLEGMDFTNDLTQVVLGQYRAMYESTIVVIAKNTGSFSIGGTWTAGNSFGMQHNADRVQAFSPLNGSGFASYSGLTPHVLSITFSPENGTTYSQADDGVVVSNFNAILTYSRTNWPDVGIGIHRVTPATAWIARVLVFSRALHYRDNASLQALILTEMDKIGL